VGAALNRGEAGGAGLARISTPKAPSVYNSNRTMNWLRAVAPIAVLLAVAFALGSGSCSQQPLAQLIQVRHVSPSEIEPGDRIDITGDGFPAGKPARVTFRGVLHRPGERPVRDAEIVLAGVAAGADEVEVPFGEATQALFCGAAGRAVHTTFEGELEVAFTAVGPAGQLAAPVAGVLPQVALDVRPSAGERDVESVAEGQRMLTFLGLRVAAGTPSGLGLAVQQVDPGSRASLAGVAAGDVLASFDGVRIASMGDLVPAPGEREATLGVRSGGSATEAPRAISVDGFRPAPPVELFGSVLIVVVAVAITLLFGAPAFPAVATALQRVVSRIRSRTAFAGRRGPERAPLVRALAMAAREALAPAGATATVDAAAFGLLAAMPFGQYLIAARLDVGLLFVAGATALATVALVASGSLWRGTRAAAHVVWQHVPAAAAVLSVVVTTGSLRVREIEGVQGAWPWDWLAFRSPAALVAFALLLACARIEPFAARPGGLGALVEDRATRVPSGHDAAPWLEAVCRAHRMVVAGLASALFLGGWLLPGLSASQQDAHPALELAGAAVFLVKTSAILLLLAWARWAVPEQHLAERTRTTALWLTPLSIFAVGASAAWTWWSPAVAAQLLVSQSLVAVVALAVLALVQRLRHGVLAPGGDAHVNEFL
jgi:NADH-quinone oxidoreductase subunit H